MDNNIALNVKNFSKKYRGRDNYAVRNASFIVKKGEFHGFIGANGAGKTTTIKSIIGAYAKFGGEIEIFGIKYSEAEAKKRIGYIPEKADFPKGMSLYRYLFSMANLSGLPKAKAKKFANDKIAEFGLEKVRKSSPNSFSSGQKKKVLLAQSLVSEPDLIIMDEPAANLDPKARGEFFVELKKLQKQGKTIFLSSHILTELDNYTDHITILDNGKVAYNGEIKKLSNGHRIRYDFKLKSKKDIPAFEKEILKIKGIEVREIKQNTIRIILKRVSDVYPLVESLTKKKILIDGYSRVLLSLQDIYDNFVKHGSIDTPESSKKAGKGA